MYTINSYLELGAGVLILWYGGKMAIDGQDSMSPGKLITYQVCCNGFISISRLCWVMHM
jgi:ABC-type bacteriocin/lantibiotic exporter with double-glycine peptidase domain